MELRSNETTPSFHQTYVKQVKKSFFKLCFTVTLPNTVFFVHNYLNYVLSSKPGFTFIGQGFRNRRCLAHPHFEHDLKEGRGSVSIGSMWFSGN